MQTLVLLALAGLVAQLVDGTLGMAYGVTSTTLLLAIGLSPAAASASVHLSEVGTTLASGISHWRLGNVNWHVVRGLALPGGVGAFLGAYVLSSVSAEIAKPWVAVFLMGLGFYVLLRFAFRQEAPVQPRPLSRRFTAPLGLIAGFLDAAGGGGWGPIATPTLLSSGRMEPRHVVGTVDTSEFVVALCASVGFLLALGQEPLNYSVVAALLIGGVIAAPFAAWLVRFMHPRLLGTAAGGLILLTNARTLLKAFGVSETTVFLTYGALIFTWGLALGMAWGAVKWQKQRAATV